MVNIKEDFHIHCNYNDHSSPNLTIPNIISRAENLGLDTIAITEHVRKDSNWTDEYIEELERLIPFSTVRILIGFEAKILLDGKIDCPLKYLNDDYFIIASFHTKYEKKTWFESLLKTINNPHVNVIGHLAPEQTFELSENEIKIVGEEIVSNNKIVEINAKYKRPPLSFLQIFKELGVKFHLGSDAHSLDEIGNYSRIINLINFIENK